MPDEQAPRKTTTYNKFEGMESQNERYNVKQNEMFWIENIMRTGPRKLSSVPGPGFRRYFPDSLPVLCTDASERGQQSLTAVTAFQQVGEVPGGSSNDRTSWGYVSPSGDVTTLNGDAMCGGGNMYYDTCCQLNRFLDNVPIVNDHPAEVSPSHDGAVNARIGIADQPAYGFNFSHQINLYFPDEAAKVIYPAPGGYSGFQIQAWCAKDDELWLSANQTAFSPSRMLVKYNRSSGAFVADYATINTDLVSNMNLSTTYLTCLTRKVSDSNSWAIKRINRTDGTLADTIDLSNLRPQFLFAVNDNLIYILCAVGAPSFPPKLYYWNGSDLIYVGVVSGFTAQPFTQGSGQFSGGRYYWGSNGFAGFPVNIYSLAVACAPDGGPVVASVTAGAASVAAGGTIAVSWADVLEPNKLASGASFHDRIVLYPAPAAGQLDFITGDAIAEQETDGTGTGSLSFTIPGGTTPGDYVFRYQVGSKAMAVLVATSDPFTVT